MNPVLGMMTAIPFPATYDITVKKMMETDTDWGLNKKIVARAEPKADNPIPMYQLVKSGKYQREKGERTQKEHPESPWVERWVIVDM